jgi:hypothetical protein
MGEERGRSGSGKRLWPFFPRFFVPTRSLPLFDMAQRETSFFHSRFLNRTRSCTLAIPVSLVLIVSGLSLSLSGCFGERDREKSVVMEGRGKRKKRGGEIFIIIFRNHFSFRCSFSLRAPFSQATTPTYHEDDRALLRVRRPRADRRPGQGAAIGECFSAGAFPFSRLAFN